MDVTLRLVVAELPVLAERRPNRSVSLGDLAGVCQVFATDARTGLDRAVTHRPQGTTRCAIDPSGERVWWFDDEPGGRGRWRTQPFEGGPDEEGLPGAPPGRHAGLAMALDGTVAAGLADDDGLTVYRYRRGLPPEVVFTVGEYANLVDISPSADLIAVSGDPHAPTAVRLFRADGAPVATLSGAGGPIWGLGFSPGSGEAAFLCVTAAEDRYWPGVWTAANGLSRWDFCDFDTEISAGWYPDGRRILVRQDRHARSRIFEVDPRRRGQHQLATPAGAILAAEASPDGLVRYLWTADGQPPEVRSLPSPPAEGGPHPPGAPHRRDVWVDGPGGPVHALLTLPERPAPLPAVFLLHGGPFDAAMDAYDPMVEVFAGAGCAVVRVNYRGSIGYGRRWREDFGQGVGLTQLADVAAVRRELVRTGQVDPARTAVVGESWGGYLALLAAGAQPELWRAVAAVSPIADYVAAFQATTAAVRSLDVRLFGGAPDEVPAAYAASSPITYAGRVRAPVLLVAGVDDEKCPPAQVLSYVEAVRGHGSCEPELVWVNHGHEIYDARGRVDVISTVVRHVGLALGGTPATEPAGAGWT